MKRDRAWIDVLDEVYGLEVEFPEPLPEPAQRLMEALGVTVVIAPEKRPA